MELQNNIREWIFNINCGFSVFTKLWCADNLYGHFFENKYSIWFHCTYLHLPFIDKPTSSPSPREKKKDFFELLPFPVSYFFLFLSFFNVQIENAQVNSTITKCCSLIFRQPEARPTLADYYQHPPAKNYTATERCLFLWWCIFMSLLTPQGNLWINWNKNLISKVRCRRTQYRQSCSSLT